MCMKKQKFIGVIIAKMKTEIFLTGILILGIATIILNPSLAQGNPDPEHIISYSEGYVIRPANDDKGLVHQAYSTGEKLWLTQDTRNLEWVFNNIPPEKTVQLVHGKYYVSKNIIGRTSMTLSGLGKEETIIIAKGAKVGGTYEPYPLTPKIEVQDLGNLRLPRVFTFAASEFSGSEGSRIIKIVCKNFTIKTEGQTAKWYRHGYHAEGFVRHQSVIVATGGSIQVNTGVFDGIVDRIDLEVRDVKIEGTDSNEPYYGIEYIPDGVFEEEDDMVGDDDYDIGDGMAFQIHGIEPANGKVMIDNCTFKNIANMAVWVAGVSSLPLPDIGPPVGAWSYPDENDWISGEVTVQNCTFENIGFVA